MPRLQNKVQRCITIKARLRNKECLFIKVNLKFLFKNSSVSYHPKVTWQTVPFCRSREREGTFSKFCTQSGFRVDAAACWTQTRSTTVFRWQAHQFSEICPETVTVAVTLKLAYLLLQNLGSSCDTECLTLWCKNYPPHLSCVCTLPCNIMSNRIVAKKCN